MEITTESQSSIPAQTNLENMEEIVSYIDEGKEESTSPLTKDTHHQKILGETVPEVTKHLNEENSSLFPIKHNIDLSLDKNVHDHGARLKAAYFILANEMLAHLGRSVMMPYLQLYFVQQYHINQRHAALAMDIIGGSSNLLPLIGAIISDTYLGKFKSILVASFLCVSGMLGTTLTAYVRILRPSTCTNEQNIQDQCLKPAHCQLAILIFCQTISAVGGAGIRACSLPFAVDQFSAVSIGQSKVVQIYFKWYYALYILLTLLSSTSMILPKKHVWPFGFVVPSICMIAGLCLFLVGRRKYVHINSDNSAIVSIIQVFAVAFKKRNLKIPISEGMNVVFYNPPCSIGKSLKPHETNQFRFLQKAAILTDNDLVQDSSLTSSWRLCSLQQIEDVKCLIRIIPIWATSIISFSCMLQQGFLAFQEAEKMNLRIGKMSSIAPASIAVISWIMVTALLPLYHFVLIPVIEKRTKVEGGLTILQRIGIGNACSVLSVISAALVERQRRASIKDMEEVSSVSAFWLAVPILLMSFYVVFGQLGMAEFYNRQFPEHIRSIGNSVIYLTISLSQFLASSLIMIVKHANEGFGLYEWHNEDVNNARSDNFLFVLGGLGVVNFMCFLVCSSWYQYKPDGIQVPGAVVDSGLNY